MGQKVPKSILVLSSMDSLMSEKALELQRSISAEQISIQDADSASL